MQASRIERLSFDPFPLLRNGLVASEVDVGRCDVVQALVVTLVIVVIHEGFNGGIIIAIALAAHGYLEAMLLRMIAAK